MQPRACAGEKGAAAWVGMGLHASCCIVQQHDFGHIHKDISTWTYPHGHIHKDMITFIWSCKGEDGAAVLLNTHPMHVPDASKRCCMHACR